MLNFLARLVFGNYSDHGLIMDIFGVKINQTDSGFSMDFGSESTVIWMLIAVLGWMIVSYLLGSINFSLVISKLAFKDDIRKYGSQNAGTTNMGRIYGKKIGALTLMGDVAKGIVSVLIARVMLGDSAAHLCGLCCMLGHCFPIYYRFKGGKGVATAAAVIFAMNPLSGVIILAIFLIVAIGMHYVSLGSIMGALFYPLVQRSITKVFTGFSPTPLMSISAIAMSLLLIARHHSNIKRLLEGSERKFYASKLFKKKGASEETVAQETEGAKVPRSLHTIDEDDEDGKN
ncbi:MAG: glycerol-3-phosphate 1-O-acyltransferase PlsY [Clostridia bacterium]|nr:glycerol-3-phosphate 1-O-acyltransferase PlsY [Clostridia bacterium]